MMAWKYSMIDVLVTTMCIILQVNAGIVDNEVGSCLLTVKGGEYVGTWNKTTAGVAKCGHHRNHTRKHSNFFESDEEQRLAVNYCRNPYPLSNKPWCYNMGEEKWEYCDIPSCTRIYHPPAGYNGWSDVHITGLNLQSYNDVSVGECADKCNAYMDSTNSLICVSFNYDVNKRICYLSDKTVDNILPPLSLGYGEEIYHYQKGDGVRSCLLTVKGAEYVGSWNKTKTGIDCQMWSSQEPHSHKNYFGTGYDVEQTSAVNYCRNPSQSDTTWCYTMGSEEWEYCDIPLCTHISNPPAGYEGLSDVHITGLNLKIYHDVSVNECAAKCNAYMASINPLTCASFDYDVNKHICYLSDRTIDNILPSLSLVYAKGIDHYQRAGLDICDIPSSDRQPLPGSPDKNVCIVQGGCYQRSPYMCWLSKSAIQTDPSCDAACQDVIDDVINNFHSDNYNQEFLRASVEEAKQNSPDITDDFWMWLTSHPEMLASMFAVKWPMEPKLVENLFHLVDAFGRQAAEDHRNLFVGVSYALINNGVINRPDIAYQKESGYFLPDEAVISEGLNQTEIDQLNAEEDIAAKAALKITAKQTQKEFDDIQERLSTCGEDPSSNWVTLYLAGDEQKLACKQVIQKLVGSVTECKKLACQRRSNGFNYVSGNCDVQFCSMGKLTLVHDGSGTYEAWLFKRESPVCFMDTNNVMNGKQEKGHFKTIESVHDVDACNEECAKRYACVSSTHDSTSDTCQLNAFLYEITVPEGEDQTRFTTVQKTCSITPEVPETGCLNTVTGEDYQGTMSVTKSGFICQHWSDQTPHTHKDWLGGPENEKAAANYCRNPSNSKWPWCYTVDPSKEWEECQIPKCTIADQPDVFTLLHASSDNMESNCYLSRKNMITSGVDACLSIAAEMRVTIAQFNPVSKICDLRMCFTSDLVITSVAAGNGWDIYWDSALVLDEGEPESQWDDRRHLSYLHEYIWDIFSLSWAKHCKVATASDLPFPPRDARMNGFDLIQHYLSRDYSFTVFPTLSAPWALTTFLWPDSSKRECNYVWSVLYNHVEPVLYSRYGNEFHNIECKESNWYPGWVIPRIIVDGGRCMGQSRLHSQTKLCFGQPAMFLAQPGHRALFYYEYNPDDSSKGPLYGPYRLEVAQGIGYSIFTDRVWDNNGRGMFFPTGSHVWQTHTALDFYKGLAASVNKGEASFEKAMIAMAVHNRAPFHQKEAALNIIFDALTENPYMVNVWFYTVQFLTRSGPDWWSDVYATECPTSSVYKDRKYELWDVAKTHMKELPCVYSDLVLKFYAPAPCCTDANIANEILTGLQEEVNSMDIYITNKYDSHMATIIVQKNMALCTAYSGGSWTEILDHLKPFLVAESLQTGKIWGYGRIKSVVAFIKRHLMDKKPDTDASKREIVQYLDQSVLTAMPLLNVRELSWILRPEFVILADYMKELYTDLHDTQKNAELEAFRLDLVDAAHGGDIPFWQNLADKGQILGAYEGILDGSKTWNPETNTFRSTVKRRKRDRGTFGGTEESMQFTEEEFEKDLEHVVDELFI